MVSGSPDVSNSFVSPCSNSFVSQSGWWCPALRMSPIHLSPLIAIHLSPLLAIHLSPLLAIHLSPIVAGGVRLSGCLQIHVSSLWRQFICLPVWLVLSGCPFVSPYSNSFVSQSGWWCPALRMSAIDLSDIIAIHLFPSLAGGVRLYGCLRFICLAL